MAILPKQIIIYFQLKNGTPATGLTPTIRIWEVTPTSNTLVVGGSSPEAFLTEVGDGFYKYRFATYDSSLKYAFRVDGEGGAGAPNLGVGRYVPGTNDSFVDDIAEGVWSHPTGSPAVQTYGDLINLIGVSTLGSPQAALTVSSIVTGVWQELLTGSPQPYPTGSAGGLLKLVSETSGLTEAQVRASVWEAPAADYPAVGSPTTMGAQLNLTTQNTVNILDYTELLMAAQYNRTFLDKIAATLTIYANDQVTPLRVFSLRDSGGAPSILEIVDRVPVVGSPLTIPPPSP